MGESQADTWKGYGEQWGLEGTHSKLEELESVPAQDCGHALFRADLAERRDGEVLGMGGQRIQCVVDKAAVAEVSVFSLKKKNLIVETNNLMKLAMTVWNSELQKPHLDSEHSGKRIGSRGHCSEVRRQSEIRVIDEARNIVVDIENCDRHERIVGLGSSSNSDVQEVSAKRAFDMSLIDAPWQWAQCPFWTWATPGGELVVKSCHPLESP